MNYLPNTIIRKFACDSLHLPILNCERIDKWLGFLCEPCFIYYHCSLQLRLWMHYIYNKHSLSLQQHFLLVSGVLLMENGKNCFTMPVCDRWLYLLCRSEREDGLRDGEMKPIISAKHTPQASRAGELDTIFNIRSFWEINTLMYRVFSLHLLGWM